MRKEWIQFFICVLFLTGCGIKQGKPVAYIDSLADTIWAGDPGEIALTSGAGAWFYADALGRMDRSVYGFYVIESKVLADWEITDNIGRSLRENIEYAIIHPEYCLRHYSGGLEERIECLPGENGLMISIKFPRSTESYFRAFQLMEQADNIDGSGGKIENNKWSINLQFSVDAKALNGIFTTQREHPRSPARGEMAYSALATGCEYRLAAAKEWSCVIYASRDTTQFPNYTLDEKQIAEWQQSRRRISEAALSEFTFICEDKAIEQAYARARLMLAGLFYRFEGEARILTGLPNSPYMDAFHSSLAGIGMQLVDPNRFHAISLLETIINRQNPRDSVRYPSRMPVKIRENTVDYSSSIAAGALALNFERIVTNSDSVPLGLPTKFLKALDDAVGAELNSSGHVMGLITGNGLFSNVGFPSQERKGALIETQALFGVARNFLWNNLAVGYDFLYVPETALKGVSEWRYPYIPGIAVDDNGKQYQIPLSVGAMLLRFRNRNGKYFDRLMIPDSSDSKLLTPSMVAIPPFDSAQTAASFLSVAWLDKNDRRTAEKLLNGAEKSGLIGSCGMHSLGQKEPDFQSSHIFVMDGQPVNAELSGDVLVWTAGLLADLNRATDNFSANARLFEELSRLVTEEGIIGGLPESVNGVQDKSIDNTARNPVFASSLAEYVRMLYDDILGIDTKRAVYPGVRLMVPKEWGKVEFTFYNRGTKITIKRIEDNLWTAGQDGSEDRVPLEVDLWLEEGVHGYGSVTLNPKMLAKFKIKQTKENYWSLAWDEFPREQ